MKKALSSDTPLIVEATANQVNQYGGYTGMQPADYRAFISAIAEKHNFPMSDIILGGDHLGPLTWSHLPAAEAMKEAKELVRLFTLAGFTKLHLDTSMRLADDDPNTVLATEVIARRGAELIEVSEAAFAELQKQQPDSEIPCYIIGSEVPIPGGEQGNTGITVTRPADFIETVEIYQRVFNELELENAWQRVVAVVVQPGVEFGDETIHEYDPLATIELVAALQAYPDLVYEGHSSDYQTKENLRKMVADDIAILKSGPSLTFAYREGLFALAAIEKELFTGVKGLSDLLATIERVMLDKPQNWQKYYHGDDKTKELARKYSFSDRVRYYWPDEEILKAITVLSENFEGVEIALTVLSQYMPKQYEKVRNGELVNQAELLVNDFVAGTIDDYLYAIVY
jgi:D-tagatose-1,6-bisphosphate aldolase subunit GatZ/KbaZ